jgi:hypothetical protein
MIALNYPSPPADVQSGETYTDGRPSARHTYGGMAYDPVRDKLFIQGGARSLDGFGTNYTWELTLSNLPSLAYPGATTWTLLNNCASGGNCEFPGRENYGAGDAYGFMGAYDPNTGLMFWHSEYAFYSFNFSNNTWTLLHDNQYTGFYPNGIIINDNTLTANNHAFVIVGYTSQLATPRLGTIDITPGSNYDLVDKYATSTGCTSVLSIGDIGAAYDPVGHQIVIYPFTGSTYYTIDPSQANWTCVPHTPPGSGPSTNTGLGAMWGRFSYSSYCDCFIAITSPTADAFILRLRPPSLNNWSSRIAGANVPGGAASIVSTQSFDTFPATNKQQYYQLYDPAQITTDCTQAADGCSLKFTILPGFVQGEPGWFNYNFSSDLSKAFGQGQEFYVQFRERLDPAMLTPANFPNTEGFKLAIIAEGDSLTAQAGNCGNSPTDTVIQQDWEAGAQYPMLYVNCSYSGGAYHFLESPYEVVQYQIPGGSGNYLDQPYAGCPHYSGRGIPETDPTCWNFVGNEWFTVQEHVKVGTWGQPNSVLDVWFAHAGQPSVLVTGATDAALTDDGSGVTGKFGKIVLLPYQTNMSGSLVNSAVWYDDLIVSTARIPDPNVGVPNAPDSLSLSNITPISTTVNWRVNSQNGTPQDDTGFLIERCTGTVATCLPNPQSGFAQIATTATGATSYTDNSVTSGTSYTYRVRAKNAAGNSAYAAAICFNGGTTCGGTVTVP